MTALLAAGVSYDVSPEAARKIELAAAEADAKTAAAASIALSVALDAPDEDAARAAVAGDPRVTRLSREAAQAIVEASRLAAWRPSADFDSAVRAGVDEALSNGTNFDEIADIVRDTVADAAATRRGRVEPDSDPIDAAQRRRWCNAAGRTIATRLAAQNVVDSAPIIEEATGATLHKLWMTQTDRRVRSSHRHLQGKTAAMDKPFWRELGTDRELHYPGDPEAPIDQTINCRCFMWLVPVDQAPLAETTFHVDDDQFALAASAENRGCGLLYGNAAVVPEDELDAMIDAVCALTAATERNYDEGKHKRDSGGRFSKAGGGNKAHSSGRRRYRFDHKKWLREGGYDAIKKKYGIKDKGKGGGGASSKGGGGGGAGPRNSQGVPIDPVEAMRERLAKIKAEEDARRDATRARRDANIAARKSSRAKEDLQRIAARQGEDAALQERQNMVRDIERQLRDHQRDIEQLENTVRGMRIRGELPEIIEQERQRLAALKGEASILVNQSRALGTSDEVRELRDRVRSSRRFDDSQRRVARQEYDSRIRAAEQHAAAVERVRQRELAARAAEMRRQAMAERKAQRASILGGGSPQSCIIALLPEGDDEIEYEDGSTAPAHLTLAYLSSGGDGIEDEFDAVDAAVARWAASRQPFSARVAGRATLGDDGDEVAIVEADELAEAREWAETDECCGPRTLGASDHPHWIPHLTGIDAKPGDEVKFDRIAAWLGDDKREYPLGKMDI